MIYKTGIVHNAIKKIFIYHPLSPSAHGLIKGMIWKIPCNNLYTSRSSKSNGNDNKFEYNFLIICTVEWCQLQLLLLKFIVLRCKSNKCTFNIINFPEIHKMACNKIANIDRKPCNNIPEAGGGLLYTNGCFDTMYLLLAKND
jgi:hypothetical protein